MKSDEINKSNKWPLYWSKVKLTITYLFLFLMVLLILFPLFVTLMSAFNGTNSLYSTSLIPENFTLLGNFQKLAGVNYWNWYFNTFFVAGTTMVLATFFIVIIGYIYSRYRFKNRRVGLTSLLLVQVIPAGSALIALYAIASSLGIYNSPYSTQLTYLYLILIYTTGSIPMNAILMKGYYDSIPRELDEAAKIDGATHFQIFKQILLPLVKPMIAVVMLFSFLGPVADVIMPSLLITSLDAADKTLAIGLNDLIANPTDTAYNVFAAGSILVAIPAILLFFKLQKYIVGGLTSGGVKG